jgi:hypothetical protein
VTGKKGGGDLERFAIACSTKPSYVPETRARRHFSDDDDDDDVIKSTVDI